jgi:excisionase family DNA binding protein
MPQEPESLWDVPELCGRLRVARSTVYDWVSQGFIPSYQIGGLCAVSAERNCDLTR